MVAIKDNRVVRFEKFLSKNIFYFEEIFMVTGYTAFILKRRVVFRRNVKPKARECGAAASVPQNGNKPQDAFIHGSNNTQFQINYYGSDYATSMSGATTQMDPNAFTKPVADILSGPALKSPTVEECGYSDRIMQLTMGNSTITTQEAANAVVAYGVWPGFAPGLGEAVDQSTTPGTAVDRFYTLESVGWTANNFNGICYRLPGVLSDMGMFGQNLRFHYLMRCGFICHIQINATKFHSGCVMVVAIPECEYIDDSVTGLDDAYTPGSKWKEAFPIHQLTLFPHQFINLRTNNSATIILPYVNACPMENAASHNYWTLCILPITPLNYAAGATTEIPITTSIAPMYVQFNGLRAPITTAQGVLVAQTPGSGQFITTIHNSGFPVYPDFQPTPEPDIPGRVTNLLQVCRVDTMVNFGTKAQPLTALRVPTATAPGANIFSWRMSPGEEWASESYLSRLSKFYVNFRGSIRLTFTFCGNAMQTAKFIICYTPPGTAVPTSRRDAMLGTHVVWDVGLQSSASLVVPWISQTQYRYANQDNKMGFAGYVTMWAQTAVVTPPNGTVTSYLIGFISATDDFQFRIPTDNAYYQGLSDDVGKVLGEIKDVTESVTSMRPKPPSAPTAAVGETPALTATETGAVGGSEAELLMETRATAPSFSGMETDVANFMCKHAIIQVQRATFGFLPTGPSIATGTCFSIPITVDSIQATRALRTKYGMFTYCRFSLEVTLLVDIVKTKVNAGSDLGTVSDSVPHRLQAIYCPPGLALPPLQFNDILNDDSKWYMPTTPSVYFSINDPPATMRIPFVSVASAYSIVYDGYSNFDTDTARYGDFPGNGLGTICIRPLWRPYDSKDGAIYVDVRAFMKPMQFKAWIPRPIVPHDNASATRTFVHEVMPKSRPGHRAGRKHHKGYPKWCKDVAKRLPRIMGEDDNMMHVIPVAEGFAIAPYHWWLSDSKIKAKLPLVQEDPAHDMVLVKYETGTIPKLCDCATGICSMNRAIFYQTVVYEKTGWSAVIEVGSDTVGDHDQEDLITGRGEIPQGWCGSPLFCKHGICGMATASSDNVAYYTHLASVPMLWDYFPGNSKWNDAEEQGPADWFTGIANALGQSFGNGFTQEIKQKVKEVAERVETPTNQITKMCIQFLVKAISASVLIARSERPLESAACVAAMLGVDALVGTPFDWLKQRISELLNLGAEEQGPLEKSFVEWVKDFNACAAAAKSLEWIGEKISKFIDWVQSLVKRQEPARKAFMEQLEHLPELMESIDKVRCERGKFSDEQVEKLIKNIECLKRGADMYGAERNFATCQIVKYYNYAMALKKTSTGTRVEPVAVCFHGTPGAGKSLATNILGRLLCQYHGGKPYSLPPDPNHFDGYTGQPVVIMDDLCQNPDGEDMKLFCQMVSSTEFIPPMADLADKGQPFKAKYVLASTNNMVLAPPTVSEPSAISRRFYLDCDIMIAKDYQTKGKLNARKALTRCKDHDPKVFKWCCPLICGKAVIFNERNTHTQMSLDDIGLACLEELDRRESTGDLIEALFQGPQCPGGFCKDNEGHHQPSKPDPVVWLTSDWDEEGCVLKTIEEQRKSGIPVEKPAPQEVVDLLRAIPRPEIIEYCEKQGWIIPQPFKYKLARTSARSTINMVADVLAILTSIASLAGFVYLMYTIFAGAQGPYTGGQPKVTPKPTPKVVVQGPNVQYSQSLIRKSLFEVQCSNGPFTGLGLFGKWMLLPRHAEVGDKLLVEGVEYSVLEGCVLETREGPLELRCVKIDRPVNFPDVRQRFPEKFAEEEDCCLAVNSGQYRGLLCPVGKVKRWGALMLSGRATYRVCKYSYPTKTGQCGGVIAACGKIIAMHVGGDGSNGYGTIILRSYFDTLDKASEQGHIVDVKTNATPIHHSTRTKLQPSVWHDVITGSKEPAALRESDPRLKVNLTEAMFSKYDNKETDLEMTENMKEAVDVYAGRLKSILPPDVTEPLTLEEAAYGFENLEGLDLNTSAGYPYVILGIKKRQILNAETRDVTKLKDCLDKYGVDQPYVTYLKDELRPRPKIEQGKTRLIECSSMNDTIRMKMMFGRLFSFFHANPGITTGCAVGCNPDVHWTKFRAELDGEIIAFDYSNYDASLNKVWFECLKEVLRKIGFHDLGPIEHIVRSRHLYKGIEYTVEGGMPSGCSGTSIFNSIINNLIIMTLVLDAYKGVDLESLKIIAYGDDVIVTYPHELDAALLAYCGKQYGLKMTPPDKSAEFKKMTWDDVTFLKRKFKPSKRYPFLIHPDFDYQEIMESLRWTRNPAHTQEHVRSLAELVWHSGRKKYEEFCQVVRSTDVGKCCILPPYRSFKRMWMDSF